MSEWSYMSHQASLMSLTSQGGIVPQNAHKPPTERLTPPTSPTSTVDGDQEPGDSLQVILPSCLQRLDSSEEGDRPLGSPSEGPSREDPTPHALGSTPSTLFGNGFGVQGITSEPVDSLQAILPPCLQRLDSSEEGDRSLGTPSGPQRDPTPHALSSAPSNLFGNGLGAQGITSSVGSVPTFRSIPNFSQSGSSVNVRDCTAGTSNTSLLNNNNNNSNNNNNTVNSSRLNSPLDIRNVLEKCGTSPPLNSSGYLSPSDTNVTPSSTSAPSLPTEPAILADKYIILGQVDAATSQAISIKNHQPLHIKAVSARTAREVCAQQAQLGECEGVRAPLEAVVSGCGRRAWLVFPPHCGDLHSYVRLRRRLREAEAQRLFAQVASTVNECHAAGLVLRDLKLRKFVFTDANRQRVVLESVEDSVVASEGDLLHDKHGCPAYVAPEILSAAAYSGRHADMWGLGVILYTMLVGRYPFHNADTSTLFARIRIGKFFIPEWVSSRARHLIVSLLRRQPQRRLSARQVLLHPWLNRNPRDHVGRDPQDHIVPSTEPMTQHTLSHGKCRPP